MPDLQTSLTEPLKAAGLILRGGFHVTDADGAPAGVKTILMVGNAGPAMWRAMGAALGQGPDPMNRWTEETVGPIAETFGAAPLYPFGAPPYYPFQRWARRAEDVHPSPLGILIHPDYGLWHAYRAALCFGTLLDLPPAAARPSPCAACEEKPCLTACPVGAFTVEEGYDVPACTGHLRRPEGEDCMRLGCRARRACPVGTGFTYLEEQAAFHMAAFEAARPG